MGLRPAVDGPKLTMAVVGRFPGTGVPAEWNVLIDQMKSGWQKLRSREDAPSRGSLQVVLHAGFAQSAEALV